MLTLGVSSLGVAVIPVIYQFTGTLDILFILLAACAAGAGLFALLLPREAKDAGAEPVPAPAE